MAEKKKLTVNLSEDVLDLLRDLAERSGNSLTEELKKAIADRAFITSKIDEGNDVVLEKRGDDDTVRTLVDFR